VVSLLLLLWCGLVRRMFVHDNISPTDDATPNSGGNFLHRFAATNAASGAVWL